jgi:hypothetical protein
LASQNPWNFLTHYNPPRTNPPLYHLLCAAVKGIVGLHLYLPAIGIMNILFGFAGVCCAYGVIRYLIASPLLRVAAIIFVLFLPFAMIHAQVIATDALATPLFWVLLWLVVRFRPQASRLAFGFSAVLICGVIIVSLLVKLTFVSCIAALLLWILMLWWTKQISKSRLAVLLLVVFLAPAIFSYVQVRHFRAENGNIWGIQPMSLKRLWKAEMNLRSLLWVRNKDIQFFNAPPCNLISDHKYPLLENNNHSFSALLHLGMFTDILNIYQPDPYDFYFGSRTVRSNSRMRIAARTGLPASVVTLIGVIVLLRRFMRSVVSQRNPQDLAALTVMLFSLAWLSCLAVMLPFIPNSYSAGFWDPRLFAPALLGFFIIAFVFLERCRRQSSRFRVAVLVYAIVQSVIHVSFLWPVESNRPLYEFNLDLADSKAPASWRVFDWQDNYAVNKTGEWWLDRIVGIAVNRPESAGVENWKFNVSLTPGPADPSSHRVVKISCRNMVPMFVEFDSKKDVELQVPLAGGRSDIRVERIFPGGKLEQASDPLIEAVKISGISFRRADGTSAVFVEQ